MITHNGAFGSFNISDAEIFVDNKSRKRSGHMSHAIVEYAPGKIIAFNSNCSAKRLGGHSAYGWLEYRYSDDYGKNWSEFHELPVSKEILLDGIYSVSMEKAVFHDGVFTGFLLRNTHTRECCCEPWDTPLVIQSFDLGKTWSEPVEFGPWKGRIYDAQVKDGIIYVLQSCNEEFICENPGDQYRLFVSTDNGKSFQVQSIVPVNSDNHGYGALNFRPDGSLLAYVCKIMNSSLLEVCCSCDNGKSWKRLDPIPLKEGIRNVQIAPLGKGYVMHGRGGRNTEWGKGQVIYTSADGIDWNDCILMEPEKQACYYSNMLPMTNGEVLLQYSDLYAEDNRVNVMHRFLSLKK
ncbi:MAG: exo-alpha-sialidase [Lentisphaeria bacterium]|nr:exo-alpha-sialidase [Lentisphaeria bacterium]